MDKDLYYYDRLKIRDKSKKSFYGLSHKRHIGIFKAHLLALLLNQCILSRCPKSLPPILPSAPREALVSVWVVMPYFQGYWTNVVQL